MVKTSSWIIGIMILIVLLSAMVIYYNSSQKNQTSCQTDDQCVAKDCCHASSCINNNYKQVCNQMCTQICEGPLDCGAGKCGCVNNKCQIVTTVKGNVSSISKILNKSGKGSF